MIVKACDLAERIVSAAVGVAGEVIQRLELAEDGDVDRRAKGKFQFIQSGDFVVQQKHPQGIGAKGEGSHNVIVPIELGLLLGTITNLPGGCQGALSATETRDYDIASNFDQSANRESATGNMTDNRLPMLLYSCGNPKDDFTLIDAGKPQPIAIFSVGPRSEGQPTAIPSGAVSNRITDRSQPAGSTTVVLVDFLNSGWIDSEYLRVGVKNLLNALGPNDRIVVYTLGKKLHVLTGFSGPEAKSALQDHGDPPTAFVDPREHPVMTLNALNTITRNLSGVAGRKNLIWAGGHPPNALIAALQQKDIVVYPVRMRSAGIIDTDMPSGGRMFLDAMDLTFAVRTAEEVPAPYTFSDTIRRRRCSTGNTTRSK